MDTSLSIIIPTIQKKLTVLNKLIDLLENDSVISEIIVINNLFWIPLNFENALKVKIITPDENLFVNRSWNLGISQIKNENFALINDDMLCVPNFCSKIVKSDIFNKSDTGLIGVSNREINQFYDVDNIDIPVLDNSKSCDPSFLVLNKYLNTDDWGIAIFGKKQNYYSIPEDLRIIYGDNYLLYKNLLNKKVNYEITGLPFNHIHSSSSASPEFKKIIRMDIENSLKYVSKLS